MDEHRERTRHRTLKAGTIEFNRAGAISCTVRNLSAGGACLEFASLLDIPDAFTLVVASDRVMRPCHVTWRRGNRLGVAFAER